MRPWFVVVVLGCHADVLSEHEAALVTGAELPVDSPVASQEPGGQASPHLACRGDTCLAVWGEYGLPAGPTVQAARIDASTGTVIDTTPIAVATSLDYWPDGFLGVACPGTECLVAWEDRRDGYTTPDIYAARIDLTTMTLADPAGIAIATGTGSYTQLAIGCGGPDDDCLVTWNDVAGNGVARRISPSSGAPDGDAFAVPTRAVDVEWTGAGWLVVGDFGDGVRVAADGTVIDTTPMPLVSPAAVAFDTRAACVGSQCLVVFADDRDLHTGYDVFANRFDATTGTIDAADTPIATSGYEQQAPDVACLGTSCLVAWEVTQIGGFAPPVYGARIDLATGADADPNDGFPIFTHQGYTTTADPEAMVRLACGASTCLASWQYYIVDQHVLAGRVDPVTAALGDPSGFPLALGPNAETKAAIACGGGPCVAVWFDARGSLERTFGIRVDAAQPSVLDPIATRLTSYTYHSRISCGTGDCLVAWEVPAANGEYESDLIAGVRVARGSGLATDGDAFWLASDGYSTWPAVGCAGETCLAVWGQVQTIKGTRVDMSTGAVDVMDGAVLTDQPGFTPAVSCVDTTCLVAWSGDKVYAARYDLTTGAVADPHGVALSVGAAGPPAVACAGSSCLVTWPEQPQQNAAVELHAATVDLATGAVAGAAIGTSTITTTTYDLGQDVACEADDCLVVWQDVRGGAPDLFVTRVDKSSTAVLDQSGVAITASAGRETSPALAVDGAGDYVVAYAQPDPQLADVSRVELRRLVARARGQGCAVDAECFDTSCIANLCGGSLHDAGVDAATDAPIDAPIDALADAGVDALADAPPGNGLAPLPAPGCGCASSDPPSALLVVLLLAWPLRSRRAR